MNRGTVKRICVFCGSQPGLRPIYQSTAEQLGQLLAQRSIELVYGGGKAGLMGIVADATLAAGGRVIGIIPESLVAREVGHDGLTELHVVKTLHERKAIMADLSDAFIVLPGGYGTLEELSEVLSWAQLGLHQKPCAFLNLEGFYDPLITFFDHLVAEKFLLPSSRSLVLEEKDPVTLLDRLATYQPVMVDRWIQASDR
jgi:uncharacterized protein (TIGR00730 family)